MLLIGFVIIQIVIFAVIILVLKRLIFQDTTSAINRLTRLDEMNREKEKVLAQKLNDAEKFFEKRKRELEEEEKRMKAEAQRAANQLHDDIIKEARTEGEEIIKKAQAAKTKIYIDAQIEAESKVIDFCQQMLHETVGNLIQNHINDILVGDFITELEKADLSPVGKDVHEVNILSGRPIDDKIQNVIKNVLVKKLNRDIKVSVKEDRNLLGGVLMRFGTMVVDGSLAERLKENADHMKSNLAWKTT